MSRKPGAVIPELERDEVLQFAVALATAIKTRQPVNVTLVNDATGARRTFRVTAVEVPNA